MNGYNTLRTRVNRFLTDNPDIQSVTLRRPAMQARRVYSGANAECYGRMPESCPIVQGILDEKLPDGYKLIDAQGNAVDISDLRSEIFSAIHSRVTARFREALEAVCDQKHMLLARVKRYQRELNDCVKDAETDLPDEASSSKRHEVEIEIETDEDE